MTLTLFYRDHCLKQQSSDTHVGDYTPRKHESFQLSQQYSYANIKTLSSPGGVFLYPLIANQHKLFMSYLVYFYSFCIQGILVRSQPINELQQK